MTAIDDCWNRAQFSTGFEFEGLHRDHCPLNGMTLDTGTRSIDYHEIYYGNVSKFNAFDLVDDIWHFAN